MGSTAPMGTGVGSSTREEGRPIKPSGIARSTSMERLIWHPSPNRWIIIDHDGGLIDVQRPPFGELTCTGASPFLNPREIREFLERSGHLTPDPS